MRGCWPNKFRGEGDARDRPINRRSEYLSRDPELPADFGLVRYRLVPGLW